MVTQNDTGASRSGKCRHSQNESKLRSHNITEPKSFDSKIYEDRNPAELWTCKVPITKLYWCKKMMACKVKQTLTKRKPKFRPCDYSTRH